MWLFVLFFLNSTNLSCRDTDISKYFRESLEFEITRVDCTLQNTDNMNTARTHKIILNEILLKYKTKNDLSLNNILFTRPGESTGSDLDC